MFCARELGENFVMTWYDNQRFKNMFNPKMLGGVYELICFIICP